MLKQEYNMAEHQRVGAQGSLEANVKVAERNRLGQYATPPQLAREIVSFVYALPDVDHKSIHFADPAVGSGSFFSALLDCFPATQIASAWGVEIDPAYVAVARELWSEYGLQVIHGDFTKLDPEESGEQPNLIIANPPYVRHHHLTREQKERLRESVMCTTGLSVSGLAGLYVYFILVAHRWLRDGGIGVWLIPAEFVVSGYGNALREYLSTQVSLIAIHFFDPHRVQFDNALVSSALVVYRKTAPAPESVAHFSYNRSPREPEVVREVPISELRNSATWHSYLRRSDIKATQQGSETSTTIGDLFRVQRGIATGANEFFIMSRTRAYELELPEEFLRPILPSPRLLHSTIIERDADNYPQLDQQLVLLDCLLNEKQVREQHPPLWAYLNSAAAQAVRGRYLLQRREPWFRQERREPTLFLCTYMGRGQGLKQPLRFVLNHSLAIAPNVYHMLYPKEPLAMLLNEKPEVVEVVFTALSCISAATMNGGGRVYGGGLHKIEPSELGRIPATEIMTAIPELGIRLHPIK